MTLKQFKCIHEWDLIGMVSFTWYYAFQKLKKEHHQILLGAPKSCKRKQKRIIAEFMFLDSSKIFLKNKTKTKPHAQPSGSGLGAFFVVVFFRGEIRTGANL